MGIPWWVSLEGLTSSGSPVGGTVEGVPLS